MNIRHVALVCRSQERADQFYGKLLGLEKSEPKNLSLALSEAIFQISSELKMVSYSDDHVHFEIFIDRQAQSKVKPIEHVCLEVQDLPAFLKKCRRLNVEILQIPKGDYLLYFIRDFDNNLFELKDKRTMDNKVSGGLR